MAETRDRTTKIDKIIGNMEAEIQKLKDGCEYRLTDNDNDMKMVEILENQIVGIREMCDKEKKDRVQKDTTRSDSSKEGA